MSASVVRRGLDMFTKKEKCGQKQNTSRKPSEMDQIPLQEKPLLQWTREHQRGGKSQRSKNTVKDKKMHFVLDKYRKKQKKIQLSENLKYFLWTDNKTRRSDTTKVVQQSIGRRSCHRPDPPKTRALQKSIFSEEDFEKFQKEYFSKL